MSYFDILIHVSKNNVAYVIGETDEGKRWIQDNMLNILDIGLAKTNHEAVNDLKKMIVEDKLTYDLR